MQTALRTTRRGLAISHENIPHHKFHLSAPPPRFRKTRDPIDSIVNFICGSIIVIGSVSVLHEYGQIQKRNNEKIELEKNAIAGDKFAKAEFALLKLTRNENSVDFRRNFKSPQVKQVDTNFVPSNAPCEDHSAVLERNKICHFGVFDGHAGREASACVAERLLPLIADHIAKSENGDIIQSIKHAYAAIEERLEKDGFSTAQERAAGNCKPWSALNTPYPPKETLSQVANFKLAMTGTCALSAHITSDEIIVANVGDSRAVLGTFDKDGGKWIAQNLSVDHTGYNEKEVESEHPESEKGNIIGKGGRVLGIAVSRALGDFFFKWPLKYQQDAWNFRDRKLNPKLLTPPYISAEPEITVTPIKKPAIEGRQFLILASDGLWDKLTSAEAVALVGAKLEDRLRGPIPVQQVLSKVELGAESPTSNSIRTTSNLGENANFSFRDDNLATHLIRNALGAEEDYVRAILSIEAPESRACRDDITVQVILLAQ